VILPLSFDDIYFSMTADIYYSTETQNDFGQVVQEWYKDREIKCSAITSYVGRTLSQDMRPDQFMDYSNFLYMRTNEDIRVLFQDQENQNSEAKGLNEILISNIKNEKGVVLYKDYSKPTIYEIRTIVPSFDEFSNLNYYRTFISRAQDQSIELMS